jgi:DNA phosphorothioation-associated putative methyltransferase
MFGELPDANVIKFRRDKAKVSYLTYNNFDRDAHPALQTAITGGLRSLNAKYRSYRESLNPPILHRKETLVPEDYPGREISPAHQTRGASWPVRGCKINRDAGRMGFQVEGARCKTAGAPSYTGAKMNL